MQEKRLAYVAFGLAFVALVVAWFVYAFVFSKREAVVRINGTITEEQVNQ
jgi:hypothetical protein